MKITEEKSIPGLLLLIDFEKAFDTVEWSFTDTVSNISILVFLSGVG